MNFDSMNVVQLKAESDRLESLIRGLDTQVADLRASFNMVRAELAKRLKPSPEPRCSEHALLRYIERVHGIDVEAIRAEIMTPSIVEALKMGASAVTVNNVKFKCSAGTIVTVLADEVKPKRIRHFEIDDFQEASA